VKKKYPYSVFLLRPRACFCRVFASRLVIIEEQASPSHLAHCPSALSQWPFSTICWQLFYSILCLRAKRLLSQPSLPLDPCYHRNPTPYLLSNPYSAGCERCHCVVHRVRGGESVLCAVALFFELGLKRVFHRLRNGFGSLGRDHS
jgi:hypothetical protein